MKAALLLTLLATASSIQAIEVSNPARFECRQGNCTNGQGTVWDAGQMWMMQGNWRNGASIPGETYTVTLPSVPGRVFKQIYGSDGLLERGDVPRSLSVGNGVVPYFSGTFKHIQHAFVRAPVAVISSGVYNTGTGFEYRGRFEYLPSKGGLSINAASGYYVFYGDLVDTEENETESGIYISDDTIGGTIVRFVKGDPSYLAVLQEKYQRDMQLAKVEVRKQESEQRSEQNWSSALSIIGNVALAVAGGGAIGSDNPLNGGMLMGVSGLADGYTGNVGNDIAISLVSSMFNQDAAGLDVQSLALQAVGSSVSDSSLSSMLTQVVLKAGTDVLTGNADVSADGLVNAMGNAVIEQTANTVGTAIGDSTGSVELGAATSNMMKQTLTNAPASASVGTVSPNGLVNAMGNAVIEQTANTVGAAIGDSTGSVELGAATSTMMKQTLSNTSTPAPAGTVSPPVPIDNELPIWLPDTDEVISARLGNAVPMTRIDPPFGSEIDGREIYATNDGVYLSAQGPQGNQVLKRTIGQGTPAGWLSVNLPKGSATFAVSSMHDEAPNEFSVWWAVYGGTYGTWNMNNGGISFSYPNAGNVHRFVPIGARNSIGGHWAIASDRLIYRKRRGGSGSTEFKDMYNRFDLERPIYKDLAATSEDGLMLYLPGADLHSLIRVDLKGRQTRYDLAPFGSGPINTLIAAHNKLWIGYGNRIITLKDDQLKPFARVQALTINRPSFCLSGVDLYTAEGRVIKSVDFPADDPSTLNQRSYLEDRPKVKPEEVQALIEARTAVNGGVYCALGSSLNTVIYTLSHDPKTLSTSLFEIRPY